MCISGKYDRISEIYSSTNVRTGFGKEFLIFGNFWGVQEIIKVKPNTGSIYKIDNFHNSVSILLIIQTEESQKISGLHAHVPKELIQHKQGNAMLSIFTFK